MQRRIVYIDNFLTGITPTTGSTLVRQWKEEGYDVVFASAKANKLLRLLDMIKTIAGNRRKSVVLLATYSQQAFYFACCCAVVCRVCGIPYVPCLHGGNLPTRIRKSPRLARWYFSNSHTNVAVSGYLRQAMEANSWRCTEIPNNIHLSNYIYRNRAMARPRLLWARSFHHHYHPELTIRVFDILLKKYPDASLTMVGPDKGDGTYQRCLTLIASLQLQDKITLTGMLTQKEWTALSNEADIFISTTNFDNLPVSVIEAMALGMIVVSSNVGGVPFLVENGKTGFLASPNETQGFVDAIERVMANPALAGSVSEQANRYVQQYDWKNVKVQWQQLFESLD